MKQKKKKALELINEKGAELLFQSIPAALYVARGHGNFGVIWMTPKVYDFTGFRSSVFIQNPGLWRSRVHPADRSRVDHVFLKSIFRKSPVSIEYRWKHRNNQYRWYVDQAALVEDKMGKEWIIGFVDDISERKAVELELQKLNRHTHDVLESISDGFIAVDKKWNYTYVNHAAASLSANRPEDLIGKNLLKIHRNFKDTVFYKKYREAMLKKKVIKFHKYYDFLDKWFYISVYPSQEGISVYFTDITERKAAEKALRDQAQILQAAKTDVERAKAKDEALLDSIGEGVVATDSSGRVTLMNRQAREMFGYDRRTLRPVPSYELWDTVTESNDVLPPNECPITQCLTTGEKVINSDYCYVTPTRKKFPAAITAAPVIFNKKTVGVIAVFRDISREKKIDQAKSDFVSLASHQLRTPLTAIKLYVEMFTTGSLGELPKPHAEAMHSIGESNQKMIELVDTLLNVSRIETGRLKITLESVNIKQFLWNTVDNLVPLADAKRVKLVLKVPPGNDHEVTTDSNLLRQVIGNLITNAIQYSPQSSRYSEKKLPVVITLEKGNKEYRLSVKDSGIGIPKDGQSKIFNRFYRAENAIKVKGDGSGLGLYMCKMVMKALGGKIWVKSEMGQGSTFFITHPIYASKKDII